MPRPNIRPDPDFARFRRTLYFEETDRVPLCDLHHDVEIKDAVLGRPVITLADDIEFWTITGYDYYNHQFRYCFDPSSGKVSQIPKDRAVRAARTTFTSPDTENPVIKSMEDFERHPWPKPDDIQYGDLEVIRKALTPGMKLISRTSGIFENVRWLVGYEPFCMLLYDNPRLIELMFKRVGELLYTVYARTAADPMVGALWLSDDIAYREGLLFSPAVMREHLFPWYRKIGDLARDCRKPFLLHSDGRLYPILDDLVECGFTAIQPIEPGAMDPVLLRQKYRGKLAIIGTIDLDYTMTRGTPDEVEAKVKHDIETLAPGGGFCIGTTNSVPYYVKVENYIRMIESAFRYGRRP